MRCRIFFCLTSLLVLTSSFCAGQITLTLQQTVDSVLSRNLQVKQAQINAELTVENLQQAKNNRLPTITASPQASFNWGRTLDVSTYSYINQRVFLGSGSLNGQITLFQGGQLRKQILQNKLLLQADYSNISKVKYDLTLSTITAFMQVLTSEDLLKAAKQQIELAKQGVDKNQKELAAGSKSLGDLAQAKAQLANSQLDEATIQSQLELSRLALQQLLEMPNADLNLIKPDITKINRLSDSADTAAFFDKAVKHNPEIQLAVIQKQVSSLGIKIAESSLYPTLALFGSVGSNFSTARSLVTSSRLPGFDTIGIVGGTSQPVLTPALRSTIRNYSLLKQFTDNFYQSAGVTLQIPIFNRLNTRLLIRKAKLSYQAADLNAEITKNNFIKIVGQSLADMRAASKRLNASEDYFRANQEILAASEKRYRVGLINSLDYSTALTTFNKAQFDLIQSRYEMYFKNKILDYYLGVPLY